MRISFVIILIVLIAIFSIAALIGVYVYKDALRRKMNAPLWTIVAVFAPSLIGLIIYLLVRGNYADLNCPKCGEKVTEDFILCPQCGARLKSTCPNCDFPCGEGWAVCPKCAEVLPQQPLDIFPPARKNDKTLGKVLLAVILIPVLLLAGIAAVSFWGFSSHTGSLGATFMPVEEYTAEKNNPRITKWIASCDSTKKEVYALRYTTEENGQKTTNFAIYFPTEFFDAIETSVKSGFFKEYVKVGFGGSNHKFVDQKYNFLLLTSKADSYLTLETTYKGVDVPCTVTGVDFDPSLS